jgi:DNA-binding GntR family transcriptional regulator
MKIQPRSLKEQVRGALLEGLESGLLAPGSRLEEIRLTKILGVSRTPIREALRGLEQEGLVQSIPNRGFRVPALDQEVVENLYPMIGALEGLALRSGGVPDDDQLDELRDLNRKMAGPELETRTRYALDRRWHEILVARNPNKELREQLERLKRRVMFYDGAWDRGLAAIERSCLEHDRITNCIANGDLDQAVAEIEQHYRGGIEVIRRWLEQRDTAT